MPTPISPAGTSVNWPIQLGHKALAKTHNLHIAFTLGVKVAAALAAAHCQTGKGVFKGLLKAEEFNNALVYAGVQTDTALVRTDSAVELTAVACVYLNIAVVVHPGHTEGNHPLRLGNAL